MKREQKNAVRRFRKWFLYSAVAMLFVLLTIFSRPSAQGARISLERCGATLIPSLFPFLVLCGFAVRCGFAERCGRILAPVTRVLFNLPGCTAAVILTALVGGFPVGARGIRQLLDRGAITKEEAARMTCFCVGAGPGFVVAAVGEGIFRSTALGLILLSAQVLAALLRGIATGFLSRRKGMVSGKKKIQTEPEPAGQALVASVADGAQAMLSLCAFVVLFGALLGLCNQLQLPALLAQLLQRIGVPLPAGLSILPVLLEVCSGTASAACTAETAIFLTAFSVLGDLPFSKRRFFGFRMLHGFIAGGLSALLVPLLPAGNSIVVSGVITPVQTTHGLPFTLALLLMIFVFLLSLPFGGGNSQKKMVE